MPAVEHVTRSSFACGVEWMSDPRPLSELPQRIWSEDDWQRIRSGYRSGDMDEKWDVFTEDGVVFLHRSWTGLGIFEAAFAPAEGGGWRIIGAMAERDPERYGGTDDHHDCLMIELVISTVVLGEPATGLRAEVAEGARRRRGRPDIPAGPYLHSVLGLRSGS
ncbi:hypothetical protein ABT354_19050 [Streptomyces sp. NPDC000594]|uniref:hypothetical protein n=1 Tax=Streptomyces sp. NPDC000594 TaxID=3154261 RepID=UPI00331BC36F